MKGAALIRGFCLVLVVLGVWASARAYGGDLASADYAISAEVVDAGGGPTVSEDYGMKTSAGGGMGGGVGLNGDAVNLAGFPGQLYEVMGVVFYSDEDARELTLAGQLYGWFQADDFTYGYVQGSEISWGIESGPVSGISPTGVMTGAVVGRDTPAVVRGTFAGLSAVAALFVRDVLPDNFGTYAADGITDAWQIEHFGEDNPLAGPLVDADYDGQSNFFEFTAGLLPRDAASRFVLRIERVPGLPGQMRLVFSPCVTGRTYRVESTPSLAPAAWGGLLDFTMSEAGAVRTVTDHAAGRPLKFYQVVISQP